jgi:L-lactate dehydrogenase complex protein LldF
MASAAAFREKIREKIADDSLQAALDANAERRVRARVTALAALPDWRERRQKAQAVRAGVIDSLDEILAQFSAKVSSNGIHVHHAQDSAAAIRIVLEIAESANGKSSGGGLLFAKAKSMLSEEIGLNQALQAGGHRVVETDLGEYIVQLRGERPAHIITPAVHLRRQQVGQLFHEKLGIPYTEDIPTLTQAARAVLREVFLTADIGLSGVNFGIAETGTLTIVSNEGNGRLCTSLPPIHIALMGMERLLPNLDDLGLFLSLLPRSATGQKLSVYTQLIHSPENGQEKHLIIVDNGRSRLQNSPLKDALYCIRCGSCLNACPVFREIGGHAYLGADGVHAPYPGPIGSVISPGLLGGNFSLLAQACSLCGACKEACPVDIDLPKLLLRVRAGQIPQAFSEADRNVAPAQPGVESRSVLHLGLAAYSRAAMHPRFFTVAQKLVGWFCRLLPPFIPLPAVTGWGLSKDLPRPAAHPFRARYRLGDKPQAGGEAQFQPARQIPSLMPVNPVNTLSTAELGAIFTKELTAVGGQVYFVQPGEFPAALLKFLHERDLQRVQIWADLPLLSAADLAEHGISAQYSYDPGLQAGITGALAGIAETGTLVIPGGVGRPLSASLVPGIHIAVLLAGDILDSLEQALRLPEVAVAPATVLVTGPSRTADIEMTLTIGVHGPRELHVFVVDASAGR